MCLTVTLTVVAILARLIAASRALAATMSSQLDMKQTKFAVDTSDNIEYSKLSGSSSKKLDVNTSDNIAYSRSDEITRKQRKVNMRDNIAYDLHNIG